MAEKKNITLRKNLTFSNFVNENDNKENIVSVSNETIWTLPMKMTIQVLSQKLYNNLFIKCLDKNY